MLTQLKPAEKDGMPYEVATAFLTDPKARLPAPFRRECERAREKVFESIQPVRQIRTFGKPAYWIEENYVTPDDYVKLTRRLAGKTLMQLNAFRSRCIRRQRNLQKLWSALKNRIDYAEQPVPENAPARYLLAQVYAQVVGFDALIGAVEGELNTRAMKVVRVPVENRAKQTIKMMKGMIRRNEY